MSVMACFRDRQTESHGNSTVTAAILCLAAVCILSLSASVAYVINIYKQDWKYMYCKSIKNLLRLRANPPPAPVAQWLARRTVGRKVWGSNPIRVMWDFSALAGSYPELGVLWAQWEGWNHTAELHPLNGCVFEGVALITWPTLQVPQFLGLVNTGIIVTVSVVCGPVK